MNKKKIIISSVAVFLAAIVSICLINNTENNNESDSQDGAKTKIEKESNISNGSKESGDLTNKSDSKNDKKQLIHASIRKENSHLKYADLYNNASGDMLPLSAITILKDMPADIKNKVLKLTETNNIYMMQKHHGKLFIITDNPSNIRHCVEFTEISINNGHQVKTTLGYNDKMNDSDNDIWEYDDSKRPIRHSKYSSNGDLDFVETWNYDNDNPIKYEMKDAEDRTISLRKETLDSDVSLRVEHLVYDKDGNTKINVSTTYDGDDVKRFTYYNADKPDESGSVYTEYDNGMKTKESIYTSDLKLKNSYTSEYKDGEREDITVWDDKNKEVEKLLPESVDASL